MLSEHLNLRTEVQLIFPEHFRFRLVSFVKCIAKFFLQPDFFVDVCFNKDQSLYQNYMQVCIILLIR